MKLSIIIPAYNEEDAIASIIERCLDARTYIRDEGGVGDVQIVVVSDGSHDRTVEIAQRYTPQISLIIFEQNRGYGAAIKEGFRQAEGDLLAFLDADGTCDPRFFATLCRAVIDQDASVAIGSRLGPESRMPPVRRLGNRAYALLLSALSNQVVSDTASGMRVIRRDALARLYPLPDGLHFTPAMSARVLMDENLSIVECPMPYEERIGESKLSVFRDGVRFLRIILDMALMWQPARLFQAAAVALAAVMVMLAMHPVETWFRIGGIDEGMIYRVLFCSLLGSLGMTLLSASVVSMNLHTLLAPSETRRSFWRWALDRVYSYRGLGVAMAAATPAVVWLIGRGVYTRLAYGFVSLHWSRVVLAGLIVFAMVELAVTVLLVNIIRYHAARRERVVAHPSRLARTDVALRTIESGSGAVPKVARSHETVERADGQPDPRVAMPHI